MTINSTEGINFNLSCPTLEAVVFIREKALYQLILIQKLKFIPALKKKEKEKVQAQLQRGPGFHVNTQKDTQ